MRQDIVVHLHFARKDKHIACMDMSGYDAFMAVASVILPACNEEGAIASVIQAIRALPLDLEIIVVDDGSTDQTAEIARSNGVKVIQHPLTLGAGRSVKDGVEQAASVNIVMLDSDGTYPVDRIPDFLAKLEQGFDLVVGARFGKEYRGSPVKFFARIVFRLIAEFATGKRIPDINSGMRAFRKNQIREYFPYLCNGFSLPTTMTLAYFFTGKMVAYIPIEYYKRIGKSKVRIIRDSLRTLQYIVESVAYFNPIKLFLMLDLLVIIMAAGAALWLQSLLILFIGFFCVVVIFALGIVAHTNRRL